MAKGSVYLMCLAAVTLGVINKTSQNFLTDGRSQRKLVRLGEDGQKVRDVIKNLALDTQASRAKFIGMVNDIVYATHSMTYLLNQGVPSIKDKHLYDDITEISDSSSKMTNEIQHLLHEKPEKLKELIAESIDDGVALLQIILEFIQRSEYKNEILIANQLRRFVNRATHSVIKTNYQLKFFNKTNKELEREIDVALEKCRKSLQDDEPKSREEFIHLIQHFEMVRNLAIIKLQNLLNINTNDQNVPIIREVSRGLKTHGSTLSQLPNKGHDVAYLKTEFQKLYKVTTKLIKKLSQVVVSENSPEEMYVRSILLDSITLSHVYEVELSSFKTKV